MAMTLQSVQAVGVSKSYLRGGEHVPGLAPTDLTVASGELVAVVGPSLSGKTTLVNLLAGWEPSDGGSVTWPGSSGVGPPPWGELTVIPQALALLDELTAAENVTLPGRLAGGPPDDQRARLDELLADLGLERLRDRTTAEISVGERQRVMVARALVDDPKVILADEPIAHQDERHGRAVLQLLRRAVDRGAACLLATRDAANGAIADRTVLLSTGP